MMAEVKSQRSQHQSIFVYCWPGGRDQREIINYQQIESRIFIDILKQHYF